MYMLQSTKLAEKLPRAPSRRSSQNSTSTRLGEKVLVLRSSRRLARFLLGPLKGVVCDLLPAILPYRVVQASRVLLVVCNALDVAAVLDVRLVDRRRHDVVLAPRYEEQGRPLFVAEVDVGVLVARGEVSQGPSPHEAARSGDVVALVDLVRLLPAQSIGEGHVELLFGEPNRLVAVCGVLQDREERADLADPGYPDALGWRGGYSYSRRAVTVIEQDLGKEASRRVAHDDRGVL